MLSRFIQTSSFSSFIIFKMPTTPESMPEIPIDFRAPPPSPVASGRRSCVTNEDVLTEFLETSLRVPDLFLPDKFFPKQKYTETPPKIDFQLLSVSDEDHTVSNIILDSIARIGCLQLVNHGIADEQIRSAVVAATGIFQVPSEKRVAVMRSSEKQYGFDEEHGEEEGSELNEEFVWCRDDGLKLKMEGIWPIGYSNFSKKMETLLLSIEKVAEKISQLLLKNYAGKSINYVSDMIQQGHEVGTICCVYKHNRDNLADRWANSLKYDVIRMLIRGTDYSHALCLHVSDGFSEFHVYSKKGWLSFCPDKGALIITGGDQIQVLSGGHYKHVIGRPIFNGEKEDCNISMGFLYSPPRANNSQIYREKTITLGQQAFLAIILTLLYHFLVNLYKKF
ncbi:1-aminocyclopropane-1-carboxylate oxidase 3 [Quillaja saponaria]|uniref:1-aminocyclopropane-1-carboxylate oxidase 3 n=1 Tax=Quillaja saponaria TaxID=32244 RepID=A0AAD7LRU7_QUISA|nr:1-aminocyclopropane-1-carboxylate oxidase 3 [Quillaja saponaria]